ncbi:NAD(P)/FAD-dependent oxidoreductase [Phenylobacterium sp.]|jgi:protoporphyrinogen oxidase|uniref:NAD(P)/FAD-dependent oxidoreductase n=1 Tax=Phenylobacterium sp. TaxID=1871053 RepID=UPI002F92D9BC
MTEDEMPAREKPRGRVIVVGAGFTGLTAAYRLARAGLDVTVFEQDTEVGGLAGSFEVAGQKLEKFYHHWFNNDRHVMALVRELDAEDQVVLSPTRTGSYYANTVFRLSQPLDVLRYRPLSLVGRLRLGFLVIQAKLVRNWRALEDETAQSWLRRMCGAEVYERVWEPLLRGKFGRYAERISAVWMWNKLALRGGSRGKGGEEVLAYYRGGFAALAERLSGEIRWSGGQIRLGSPVTGFEIEDGRIVGVRTAQGVERADGVICTTPLPVYADLVAPHVTADHEQSLRRIDFIGNVCLTLELDRSLSDTYWLNVTDPDFPFVGVIEHTNFQSPADYGGRHIVYLSKYVPTDSELYGMSDDAVFEYALPYLQRMFPELERSWVLAHHTYRAAYSQPLVGLRYSELIPEPRTPLAGLYLATMAQIYPEDRGTNYAIRQGEEIAAMVAADLSGPLPAETGRTGSP